jgi:hypothetical protein
VGQACRQLPQPRQRLSKTKISGWPDKLSGLWHHQHRKGQPFRNTVVRIPGPSWIEYFWILATNPLSITLGPGLLAQGFFSIIIFCIAVFCQR